MDKKCVCPEPGGQRHLSMVKLSDNEVELNGKINYELYFIFK